jgi:hypothetical protein
VEVTMSAEVTERMKETVNKKCERQEWPRMRRK